RAHSPRRRRGAAPRSRRTSAVRRQVAGMKSSGRIDRRHPLVHGLLLLAVLLVYALYMARRTIDPERTQVFTEAPLVLYLFLLFRAPLRDRWWSSLVAALPIAWVYGVHDQYYLKFHKVP